MVESTLNTLNLFIQNMEMNGGSLGARKWVNSDKNENVLGHHIHIETISVLSK